jgi:hypothetical protein
VEDAHHLEMNLSTWRVALLFGQYAPRTVPLRTATISPAISADPKTSPPPSMAHA